MRGTASQLSLLPYEEHLKTVALQKEGGPPPHSVLRGAAFSLGNAPAQLVCAREASLGRQAAVVQQRSAPTGGGLCPTRCQLEIPPQHKRPLSVGGAQ